MDVEREEEKISHDRTSAPRCTAATGPSPTSRDVDVVVHRNLLVRRNITTCHEERAIAFIKHVRIRVATVINVSIRRAKENDLAIGIIAVIGSFTEVLPQERGWRDLSHYVDLVNALPSREWSRGKEPQSLDSGCPSFDIVDQSNSSLIQRAFSAQRRTVCG